MSRRSAYLHTYSLAVWEARRSVRESSYNFKSSLIRIIYLPLGSKDLFSLSTQSLLAGRALVGASVASCVGLRIDAWFILRCSSA